MWIIGVCFNFPLNILFWMKDKKFKKKKREKYDDPIYKLFCNNCGYILGLSIRA